MSEGVRRLIARGPLHGMVSGVFRSALNIDLTDRLVAVVVASAGGLPNGVSIAREPDLSALGARAGMVVLLDSAAVRIPAASLVIDLSAARIWSARVSRRALSRTCVAAGVARARSALLRSAPVSGLGGILRAGSDRDPFRSAARPAVAALLQSARRNERAGCAAAASRLVGLGPGLTPSGDDLLAGFLAALFAAGHPLARPLGAAVAAVARERTTSVAATLLGYAARGEFAERVHLLLDAMARGDERAIEARVAAALAWGASSGADLVAGVVLGASVAWPGGRAAGLEAA